MQTGQKRQKIKTASSDDKQSSDSLTGFSRMSSRPFLVPPRSRLFGLLFLLRFLSGGHLLGAVKERAECHTPENVPMSLLDELHQLADVAVQTLRKKEG